MGFIDELAKELRSLRYHGRPLEIEVDARDLRGGEKSWEWIKKGVPLRIEVGPRDVEQGGAVVSRRDKGPKDKTPMKKAELVANVLGILDDMQSGLYAKALAFRKEHTRVIDSRGDFDAFFTPKGGAKGGGEEKAEIHGGFALAHWSGDAEVERELKEKLKVTVRNIPEDMPEAEKPGTCIFTGKPSERRVLFAKAY
jgi:prolyl-tRNA synthetase